MQLENTKGVIFLKKYFVFRTKYLLLRSEIEIIN